MSSMPEQRRGERPSRRARRVGARSRNGNGENRFQQLCTTLALFGMWSDASPAGPRPGTLLGCPLLSAAVRLCPVSPGALDPQAIDLATFSLDALLRLRT